MKQRIGLRNLRTGRQTSGRTDAAIALGDVIRMRIDGESGDGERYAVAWIQRPAAPPTAGAPARRPGRVRRILGRAVFGMATTLLGLAKWLAGL